MLSGPEPWRAQGFAKIKVLFFSFKDQIQYQLGEEQKAVAAFVEPDELLEKLKLQLEQTSNWTGKLAVNYTKAESLRSLEEAEKQRPNIYSSFRDIWNCVRIYFPYTRLLRNWVIAWLTVKPVIEYRLCFWGGSSC